VARERTNRVNKYRLLKGKWMQRSRMYVSPIFAAAMIALATSSARAVTPEETFASGNPKRFGDCQALVDSELHGWSSQ